MLSTLNLKKYFQLLIFLLIIIYSQPVTAETNNKNLVNIYFFHSSDCSHCQSEIKFLDQLEKKYNNIKIYRYEIHDTQNNEARINVQKIYNLKNSGVPLTIIGDTAYTGYLAEKSNLLFTKTIEYYSRYGYQDKVGSLLQIEVTPTFEISTTAPTLDEFLETYGNYKLIGPLSTDNLDASTNAIVLGLLSQFNLIKLLFTFIVLILLSKIKKTPKKLSLLAIYLTSTIILNTIYITSNDLYTLIIGIAILVFLVLSVLKYIKTKKIKYLYRNIIIIISIISSYLENYFYISYASIFKEIATLHNLEGLNKISYYSNYLFVVIIINVLYMLIFYYITNKFFQKKISQ